MSRKKEAFYYLLFKIKALEEENKVLTNKLESESNKSNVKTRSFVDDDIVVFSVGDECVIDPNTVWNSKYICKIKSVNRSTCEFTLGSL